MLNRLIIGFLMAASPLVCQQFAEPEFVSVPAGEFSMGSRDGATWERPVHSVATPAFEISAYPVTNREFQVFRPSHRSPGDESPTAPVTGVTWDDAVAYAEWLEERLGTEVALPTEARWEKSIRGGLEQAKYPWGNEFAPGATPGSGLRPAPRPNAYGVYAVAYNLWEWTSDWYSPDAYRRSTKNDPTGPASGDFRVLRGGGFRSDPASATCYSRGSARPSTSSAYVTFRVMKTGRAPVVEVTEAAPQPARPVAAPAPAPSAPAAATPAAPSAAPVVLGPGVQVTALTHDQTGGQLRIRLTTASRVAYRYFALSEPDRLVVDLQGAIQAISRGSGSVAVGQGGVQQIRYSQFQMDPPIMRVVIDLDRPLSREIEASETEVLIRLSPSN